MTDFTFYDRRGNYQWALHYVRIGYHAISRVLPTDGDWRLVSRGGAIVVGCYNSQGICVKYYSPRDVEKQALDWRVFK